MAAQTLIEWAEATWNIITGCTRVSRGCGAADGGGCYAERLAATRLRHHPSRRGLTDEHGRWTGEVRLNKEWLDQPLRWQRPRRIFVCAHSDLFHEAVPEEWIDIVFAVMAQGAQHTFQILTKRPRRARGYLARLARRDSWPFPNVWLGTSVEDQRTANARIPALLEAPAAVRWISVEPLLGPLTVFDLDGPVDVREGMDPGLHWVVAGGESGPRARPMDPEWARSLRDQCQIAGVPFFFKQWGGATAKAGGRVLDGRTWDQLPAGPGASRPGGSVTSAV